MNYDKFKGKKYNDMINAHNIPILIAIDVFLMMLAPCVIYLDFAVKKLWDNCLIGKDVDLALILGTLGVISLNCIIYYLSSIAYKDTFLLVKDVILIEQTEKIREELLIDELPVDVDLADYFKQREIDLVEAETKGDIDLMKKVYLKGKDNGL